MQVFLFQSSFKVLIKSYNNLNPGVFFKQPILSTPAFIKHTNKGHE